MNTTTLAGASDAWQSGPRTSHRRAARRRQAELDRLWGIVRDIWPNAETDAYPYIPIFPEGQGR